MKYLTIFFLFLYGLKFIETSKGIGEDTVNVLKLALWNKKDSQVEFKCVVFHIKVDQLPKHVVSK